MADKELQIKISGDAAGFGKAANEVTRQINGIRDNIRNLPREAIRSAGSQLAAFFSVDWIASQVNQTMEYAGAMQDLAEKVGVGVEFLQELDYAATQTGASVQDFVTALREVQRSQAAADANPGGRDAQWFQAIGVSVSEIRSLNPEELFRRVAAAIQSGKQGGQQLEAAIQLLGRSAVNVLPSMRSGFISLAQEARNLGVVIQGETIARMDALGDRIEALKKAARGLAVNNPLTEFLLGKAEAQVLGGTGIVAALNGALRAAMKGQNPFSAAVDAFKAARDSISASAAGNQGAATVAEYPVGAQPKALSPLQGSPVAADALQRIGLFIGAGASQTQILKRQLDFLQRSNELQARVLATLKSSNDVGKSLAEYLR